MKKKAVFGIFKTRNKAEGAVDAMKMTGFSSQDISVLLPQRMGSQDFVHTRASKAPEGAVTGAGTGAVIGGALGLLMGIGALAVPGVGPLIVAGPIMSALAGIGSGGMIGALSGALIGYGIPEYEARRYEGAVRNGGILLSVHTDTEELQEEAKEAAGGEERGPLGSRRTAARPIRGPICIFYPGIPTPRPC